MTLNILFLKLSSLGDIIHAFPAYHYLQEELTDRLGSGNFTISWLVEENFETLTNLVNTPPRTIATTFRKQNKETLKHSLKEIKASRQTLKSEAFDIIIDAQGLIKTAALCYKQAAEVHGYDWNSVREPLAAYAYTHRHSISKEQHAAYRIIRLVQACLESSSLIPPQPKQKQATTRNPDLNYNLSPSLTALESLDQITQQKLSGILEAPFPQSSYVVFLHGTTWKSKLWPETSWVALGKKIKSALKEGQLRLSSETKVLLLYGNLEEKQRAQKIAQAINCETPETEFAVLAPKLELTDLLPVLNHAKAVVSVDTGLGHLSAALSPPCIGLYGPTDPNKAGLLSLEGINLQSSYTLSPCYRKDCMKHDRCCMASIQPQQVYSALLPYFKV